MNTTATRLLTAFGTVALVGCQSQEPTAQEPAPAPSSVVPASGEPVASVAASASESAAAPVASAVVSASSSANPDPQAARQAALRDAAEFGMIGLKNRGPEPDAPKVPWGREDVFGDATGLQGARGNMWGEPIGENYGAGGLGLRGTGPGGGGRGEGIGLGGLGSGRLSGGPKGPSVRMGATTVNGRLPPEVIQRIVRQQFGRFRLCYEKALPANPTLAGKVTTTFTIRSDGSTEGVSTNSDLADKEVAPCVAKVFAILSYPQPEGGVVKVSYPILFSPGDAKVEAATKTEPSKAEPTIAGKPLAEVTALEVEKALRDAGFTEVSSRVASGSEAVVFTAKKGTRTFTLTFVSQKAGKDALSAEERKRLLSAAKVYTDFGIFLAVESDDAAESQALLDLLIKPAR